MRRPQPTVCTLLAALVWTGSGAISICRGNGEAPLDPPKERALAARARW